MYLTYPLYRGITVTDSQGLSPYSMDRRSGLQLAPYQIGDIVSYNQTAVKRDCGIFQFLAENGSGGASF